MAESLLKKRVLEAVCEKKALSPAARREAVRRLSGGGGGSARAACRILRLARSTYRNRGRPLTEPEAALQRRLQKLSERHPRYGYRQIAALLRQEGWTAGKRLVQRWRRNEGLRVTSQNCWFKAESGLSSAAKVEKSCRWRWWKIVVRSGMNSRRTASLLVQL